MKQGFLTISLASLTISLTLLVFIDVEFTFYIWCTRLDVYEYTKTKGLDSREVTSLPKCQHVIKMIAENKLHAAPWLAFAKMNQYCLVIGLVCDFECLMLSYNLGQK